MKITHRTLLIFLLPLLPPLTASAEPETEPDKVSNNLTDTQTDHRLGTAWRASEVIGTDVKNAADETIGKVEDLAIDLKAGEILAVVISSGGFLGVADTLSSVPPSALRFDTAAKSFKTSLTKEQLQKAPRHKTSEHPDYSDSAVMKKLREFRDSIGGDANAADNTAANKVDADQNTLTPADQGTSESDVKTTKDIRVALMSDELSFNAKNIKIITKDGHVTLRGVVDSAAEHDKILKLAAGYAHPTHLTDDLKVK